MFKLEISKMDFRKFHFLLIFEYLSFGAVNFHGVIARYNFNKHDKNCIFEGSFQLLRKYPNEIRKNQSNS